MNNEKKFKQSIVFDFILASTVMTLIGQKKIIYDERPKITSRSLPMASGSLFRKPSKNCFTIFALSNGFC